MPTRRENLMAHYRPPPSGPQRDLVAFIFVDTFGYGLYLTAGLLYLTRSVGLPVAQVGVALSLAGLIALPSNVGIGKLADRFDPRSLTIGVLVVEGFAMLSLIMVRSVLALAVVATISAIAAQGGRTLRSVLIARIAGEDRLRLRSYSRSAANLAIALAAPVAGVAVQLDNRPAYLAVIVVNTATFFAAALIVLRLPRHSPIPLAATASKLPVLHNRAYLAVTALNGIMTLQYGVLGFVMPLWIVERTSAPRAMVAGTLLLNTALIVLLQVRMGQRVSDVRAGSRTIRLAGVVFLFSCTGLAFTGELSPWAAVIALLILTGLHTAGELWHAAAAFELSYHLAPEHAQGAYQGVFALGVGASQAATPALLALLCLDRAPQGWLILGALLAVSGALTTPVARAAERHLAAAPLAVVT